MKRRKLGKAGLEVSELGLGCMGMSWAYGTPDRAEAIATIHRAVALGVDFFDTAELYGPYTNEELLGDALVGRREEVLIATKFGFNLVDGTVRGVNSHPKQIRKVCDESLRRLKTDRIDLFYQHRVDPGIPIEEVVGTVAELVDKGKVRFIGLSEANSETLRKAQRTAPVSALQSEYSLWERGLETDIIPTARELGVGIVPYSPLGRGFLTGQIKKFDDLSLDDYRRNDPRYQGSNFAKNLKLVQVIAQVADKHDALPAQVALAWVLSKGDDMVPIPGTKRVRYLEQNVEAAQLRLDPVDIEELDSLSATTVGARYDTARMAMIDQ